MIFLPLMTKPVPEDRRTESKRQGASQIGCWLKLLIRMTDRSGEEAPNAAMVASETIRLLPGQCEIAMRRLNTALNMGAAIRLVKHSTGIRSIWIWRT